MILDQFGRPIRPNLVSALDGQKVAQWAAPKLREAYAQFSVARFRLVNNMPISTPISERDYRMPFREDTLP